MRKISKTKKLTFKKFQISKIQNPQFILGGNAGIDDDDDCPTDTQRPG